MNSLIRGHIFTTLYVLIVHVPVFCLPESRSRYSSDSISAAAIIAPNLALRSAPRPPRPRCPPPPLPPGCLPCPVHGPCPIPRPARVTPLLPQRVRAPAPSCAASARPLASSPLHSSRCPSPSRSSVIGVRARSHAEYDLRRCGLSPDREYAAHQVRAPIFSLIGPDRCSPRKARGCRAPDRRPGSPCKARLQPNLRGSVVHGRRDLPPLRSSATPATFHVRLIHNPNLLSPRHHALPFTLQRSAIPWTTPTARSHAVTCSCHGVRLRCWHADGRREEQADDLSLRSNRSSTWVSHPHLP
jgi:hypothetical protein